MTPSDFIDRWSESGASEESNAKLFLSELCDLLGVDRPDPAGPDTKRNSYVFERRVDYASDADRERGYIDLYREGCFVLEAKQGSSDPVPSEAEDLGVHEPQRTYGTARRGRRTWERAMTKAKNQAFRYAKALPEEDGWPPFLIVVDVGHCIDLYADFARQGKNYVPFPDQPSHRIHLEDLREEPVRDMLRQIWTDPLGLDPTRRTTAVTRDLAEKLAKVAQSLEKQDHDPDDVSGFLMRCLFTMFAEDVGLLPERSFTGLLERCRGNVEAFPKALRSLWATMDEGGFDPSLMTDVREFNGGLFADHDALPVSEAQLELLIEAAEADWADVEPAIFGTLLERALDPRERHKLGAHFTPRAYVERLVVPTVIEPLRDEWDAVQTAATQHEADGEGEKAIRELRTFHHRLCNVTVLDPACGSGNFLYVTLEHLKRLEAEVLDVLATYGVDTGLDMTGGNRVSPEQLLGLEINPRAAAITDVVLWIGYLQWHFRTHGDADRLDPPILKDYGNIQCRDAVLDYDEKIPRTDENGEPVTRWDGRTHEKHPTTGEMVPDESAQVEVYEYENPDIADWPEANFIVGNPPFVGNKRMRFYLGDGYTEALRSAYSRRVRKDADYVMYWWYKASRAVRKGSTKRFGLVSTNSITQSSNRKLLDKEMKGSPPITIAFAVPDHPWVASRDGSDVRISMTVGAVTDQQGSLQRVVQENRSTGPHWDVELAEQTGNILSDLTVGADVAGAEALEANDGISNRGVTFVGQGFVMDADTAYELGRGRNSEFDKRIRPIRNGRDLTDRPRGKYAIDLFGLEAGEAREQFPELYQWVHDRVKPERDQSRRANYREYWWVFGEPRADLRDATEGLGRFIATPMTAKHRFFTFLDTEIIPDQGLIAIALENPFYLGVLSSSIHVEWSLAAGGRLGVGNDPRYNNTQCFDPFPFPAATESQKDEIRRLGEQLDRHRKERLDEHEDLTMTGLYNVLEKERSGEPLGTDERDIHEKGLVGVLKEIHDDLDAAVAEAYGWEAGLPEEEILQRLVDLNAKRRAEEKEGHVRWLRPEYQAPEEAETQAALDLDVDIAADGDVTEPLPWPSQLKERAQAIRQVMAASSGPLTVEQVARHFHHAPRKKVKGLLETLEALGLVEKAGEEAFAA